MAEVGDLPRESGGSAAGVEATDSPAQGRKGAALRLAAVALILVGGFLVARLTPAGEYLTREGIGAAIEQLRNNAWAPVIFIAIYAAATALAVPGTVLTLAGGAVFGFAWGTVYNAVAANIGANAAFALARGLGKDSVRRLAGSDSKALARLDGAVSRHGFQGLLTLRLIPLVPFNVLNFGSGLLPIRWSTYAAATAIGILPGTAVYTFFAEALLQGSQEASRDALARLLLAGGLLALLSFLPAILKRLGARLPGMGSLALALTLGLGAAPALGMAPTLAATPGSIAPGAAALQQPTAAREPTPDLPSHDALTRILSSVVDGGNVDYRRLVEEYERPDGLAAYVQRLSATEPAALQAAPAPDRLAFWINAYNACMLKRVVEHYPIVPAGGFRGLRIRAAGRPANSVWQIEDVFTGAHCPVAGALRSQDEIEHEIIRPMGDPRIHFAVNCAARSCPPLVPQAYEGISLDQQLDERVVAFMADSIHFTVANTGGQTGARVRPVVRVNKVLDWYKDDFGGHEGVLSFLAGYAEGAVREALEHPDAKLEFFEYDWTLNDTSTDTSR